MDTQLLISITRQLGSGGAFIGRELATRLNIRYADRVIIREAAKQLEMKEKDLEGIEEKQLGFWQTFLENSIRTPGVYIPPQQVLAPRDRVLFDAESRTILDIAKEGPAVIIGRCGFHILREYPNHVKLFLHGEPSTRVTKVMEMYGVESREEAERIISKSDKARDAYCRGFTGQDRTDARNFDLSIDTSTFTSEQTLELILSYLKIRKLA